MMKLETLQKAFLSNSDIFGEKVVYRFLQSGLDNYEDLTLAEVRKAAQSIATAMFENAKKGDRALLLFPPGLDFCKALWACFASGIVAVPVPLTTDFNKIKNYIAHIQTDCNAKFLLTTSHLKPLIDFQIQSSPNFNFPNQTIEIDKLEDVSDFEFINVNANDIALLQYTSGSVSDPKGVILKHENIVDNILAINKVGNVFDMNGGVCWLPHFHDMGLIGHYLIPVFSHKPDPLAFMSPISFIEKPVRWLHAISKFNYNISAGPNFAYDICTNRIAEKDLQNIDLSCWDLALCGSEPVNANVMHKFINRFQKYGFKSKAINPCYGLAEATLMVSCTNINEDFKTLNVNPKALNEGKIEIDDKAEKQIVSCGKPTENINLKIISKDNKAAKAGEIGEIVIAGKSVANGYWNKQNEDFNFLFEGEKYFKTGDLGTLIDGELYVTGRKKDLIIIRGKNIYPQDIELAVAAANNAVRNGCVVAYAAQTNKSEETYHLAVELKSKVQSPDFELITNSVLLAVSKEIGVKPEKVFIFKANQLPKTSSGKLQRSKTKKQIESGTLTAQFEYLDPIQTAITFNDEELTEWLKMEVSKIGGISIEHISVKDSIFDLGIESIQLPALLDKLKNKVNNNFDANVWIENPTIENAVLVINENEKATSNNLKSNQEIESTAAKSLKFPNFDILNNK